MTKYRVYYLDGNGRIEGAEDIDAADDAAAVALARVKSAERDSPFEVWHDARPVHRDRQSGGAQAN